MGLDRRWLKDRPSRSDGVSGGVSGGLAGWAACCGALVGERKDEPLHRRFVIPGR